ncbi:OstA-like protein [Taibaiella koreensis]|uniref:OstA-like protein n=1 Tax=Taibaiella koreensis TaxID=1268548 RepID=UPI0013C3527A|nr:OstA-like protein [Taibaiella koreensis]
MCTGRGLIFYILLILAALGPSFRVAAQQTRDSSKTTLIRILENEYGEFIQSDSSSVHKLKGNVKLLHGSDTLYCDSAYFYTKKNNVEAFGDVVIRQADGTEASADYMRYNGGTKIVYMRADQPNREVQLYDGKLNTLWSQEIDYNMTTKIGRYKRRGYLQTESTNLESNTGEYNMRSKEARFRGDVVVNDPEYQAVSTDLGYNTGTKITRFFGPSVVTNDKSVLQTSKGVYDTRNRAGHFVERSSITNESQYIEADTLDYDRNSGFGFAIGNVIAIDTSMKSTLYCGYAQYNEIHKTLLAYIKPLMKKMNGKKALFIKADTFFSAPDPRSGKKMTAQDSLQRTADEIRAAVGADSTLMNSDSLEGKADSLTTDTSAAGSLVPPDDFDEIKDTVAQHAPVVRDTAMATAPADSMATRPPSVDRLKQKMDTLVYQRKNVETGQISSVADTMSSGGAQERRRHMDSASMSYRNSPEPVDTAGPRYFLGYHHVLVYSDSLQGKCDSIRYSQLDSLLRMYTHPLLWPQNSQLKGDIIYLQMDSSKLREVFVPRNAIMISRNGPEKAGMFDQIQGNTIRAYLRDNKMDSLIAVPNASSIYFIKDDDSAYVGSSEAKSDKIEVHFENEAIRRIYYRVDVEQKTTPMKDVQPATLRLSRFSWDEKQRPKTLEEFLEGTTLPHEPLLIQPAMAEETILEEQTAPESQPAGEETPPASTDKRVQKEETQKPVKKEP